MKKKSSGPLDHAALRPFVPYISAWSEELEPEVEVVAGRRGIRYRDEVSLDRDDHGVLWYRIASQPGRGEPQFRSVHSLRQRRAMRRLLCHVCGGPPDRTDDGYLWLLPDHRGDWDNWPHELGITEPPVCVPCARRSMALCPALRRQGVAVLRIRQAPIVGVRGALYTSGPEVFGPARAVDAVTITYGDYRIRWTRAHQQVRSIEEFTMLGDEEIRWLRRP